MTPAERGKGRSVHIREARASLRAFDKQIPNGKMNLRDAIEALIEQAEAQQETINRLVAKSHEVDPMRPLG